MPVILELQINAYHNLLWEVSNNLHNSIAKYFFISETVTGSNLSVVFLFLCFEDPCGSSTSEFTSVNYCYYIRYDTYAAYVSYRTILTKICIENVHLK